MAKKEQVFPSTYYNSKAVAGGPILLTINFAQIEPVGEVPTKRKNWLCTSRRRTPSYWW